MSELIVLSDSSDSVLLAECDENNEEGIPRQITNDNVASPLQNTVLEDDFDFPAVEFNYVTGRNETEKTEMPRDIDGLMHRALLDQSPQKLRSDILHADCNKTSSSSIIRRLSAHCMSDSSESDVEQFTQRSNPSLDVELMQAKYQRSKKLGTKSKDKPADAKAKKKEDVQREKLLKSIASKKMKDIQPGECMKFMEVVLDESIGELDPHNEICTTLESAEINYNTSPQAVPNSITWKRRCEDSYVGENNVIKTNVSTSMENQMMIVWNYDEVVKAIADDSFCTSISRIKTIVPNYTITLVIFGMRNYFHYFRNEKNGSCRSAALGKKTQRNGGKNSLLGDLPQVSEQQLKMCLVEIQLTIGCNSRSIESVQDLAMLICQYTKAIAEKPYRLEKRQQLETKFDWYVMGDNRDTVRVDKDGNGLKRLWQQQLRQFNLSSLETAEAICSVYSSPAQLFEAYSRCTPEEGPNLLKDIPIRRAAGVLTTMRKVGPELSKKIYTMFTSKDGDAVL